MTKSAEKLWQKYSESKQKELNDYLGNLDKIQKNILQQYLNEKN